MSWLREARENEKAARELVAVAGGAAGTLLGGAGLDREGLWRDGARCS